MNHEELIQTIKDWSAFEIREYSDSPEVDSRLEQKCKEVIHYLDDSHINHLLLEQLAASVLLHTAYYGKYDEWRLMQAMERLHKFLTGQRENFFDAVRADKQISDKDRAYWLSFEPKP